MSNYNRIEVNLLPPELLPPPTLRLALIANIAIVAAVLAYVGLASYTVLVKIPQIKADTLATNQQIQAKSDVTDTHKALQDARDAILKYGRLVSLASVDYVDIPVLMDRLARVIPDGVFLAGISNEKAAADQNSTVVQIILLTSKSSPELVQAALDNFKRDSIFQDCYMADVAVHKESLNDQLPTFGVTWQAQGPNVPATLDVSRYQFSIMARVPKIVDAGSLPVLSDKSTYLADVKFLTPPPPADKNSPASAKPRQPGQQAPDKAATGAPAGVKPTGVN